MIPMMKYDFVQNEDKDSINIASPGASNDEDEKDLDEEEPLIFNDQEMKIEEIISEPLRNTSILKQNLKKFLEDNDEDNFLEVFQKTKAK